MRLAYCLGMLILMPLHGAYAQQATQGISIIGTISAETTLLPIPNAHVYIANTTHGDITAADGSFQFKTNLPGSFLLVVTSIGYAPYQKSIRVDSTDLAFDIRLEEIVYETGDVTVEAKGLQPGKLRRKLDLSIFKRLFLGTTENRQGCKIVNADVIRIARIKGLLQAWSDEPIVIENRALGFKVSYLLTAFSAMQGEYRFTGEPFFELLAPKNKKEEDRWVVQRAKTFEGSFQHFLRSLANNTLEQEGFEMYPTPSVFVKHRKADFMTYLEETGKQAWPIDSVLTVGIQDFERRLSFEDYLHVFYTNEHMPRDYFEDVGRKAPQRKEMVSSAIKLAADTTTFNVSGFLNTPFDVSRLGFWGWEVGICNWLPFGYGLNNSSIDRPINTR